MELKKKTDDLQGKPEIPAGGMRLRLLVTLGALVLLVGGGLILWQVVSSQAAPPAQVRTTSTPTPEPTKSGPGDPQAYYDAVKSYVAQHLHLSEGQIKAKLEAGVQLIALAQQQGISNTELRTILLDAEQEGHNVLVRLGRLTKAQSDAGMRDLRTRSLQALATSIKYDFLDH
jgi:AraC-like DNA-binding protein